MQGSRTSHKSLLVRDHAIETKQPDQREDLLLSQTIDPQPLPFLPMDVLCPRHSRLTGCVCVPLKGYSFSFGPDLRHKVQAVLGHSPSVNRIFSQNLLRHSGASTQGRRGGRVVLSNAGTQGRIGEHCEWHEA
jgi:hypothetical protein